MSASAVEKGRTPPRAPTLGARARRAGTPPVALGAGAAAVALVMAITAVQIDALVALDESVYKLSAAQYATGLDTVVTDDVARGTARLYSLLVAPLFALLPGDDAVRAARLLNTLIWASAAVPVYLLARLVAGRWTAVAAGLLAIAVPWATVSTVLFSESLSYALFAWAMLAMAAALRSPSPRRDAVALALLVALVATRMQFVALAAGWVAVVAGLEVARARAARARPREAVRAAVRRFPFLAAAVALTVLVGLVALAAGRGGTVFDRFTGPYSEVQNRNGLPPDMGLAALFEVAMLAGGVGVVPAALALCWAREAFTRRAGGEAFRLVVLATTLLVALFAVTLYAQGGWLGPDRSEERYYVYAIPLVFVAAAGALGLPALRRSWLAIAGGVLVCLLLLAPTTAALSAERAFLAPVSATAATALPRLDGDIARALGLDAFLSQRDMVGLLAVLVTGWAVVAWPRRRWAALVPAVVVQLAIGGYALSTMRGNVGGVPGVVGAGEFERLAWVDHATASGGTIPLATNLVGEDRPGRQLTAAFWNDELLRVLELPEAALAPPPFPVSALPRDIASAGTDLTLGGDDPGEFVVSATDSPAWQLAGRAQAASPGGELELLRLERPARLTWLAAGLEPDGHLVRPLRLRAAGGARVTFVVSAPAEGVPGAFRVTLGGRTGEAEVALERPSEVTIDLCGSDGVVDGTLEGTRPGPVPDGRSSSGRLGAVRVEPC